MVEVSTKTVQQETPAGEIQQTPEQILHNRITEGLDHIMNLEMMKRSPSSFDMLEFFQTLKDVIQNTSSCVDIAVYKPNKAPRGWENQVHDFDFVRDVTGMMTEIYINDPNKESSDVRWSNFFKLVFEPLMERLGKFKHRGVLMCATPIIDKYAKHIHESNATSTDESAALAKQVIQIKFKKRQQLEHTLATLNR